MKMLNWIAKNHKTSDEELKTQSQYLFKFMKIKKCRNFVFMVAKHVSLLNLI